MGEFMRIGKNTAATEEMSTMDVISDENITIDAEADAIMNENTASDEVNTGEFDAVSEENTSGDAFNEGMEDGVTAEPSFEEGEIGIPEFDEGYVDPGYVEGEIMYPDMETGMSEVKDPLLSSWPFVIGISAAVLLVSIALGAFLAKLKIKKGIDLYED